MQSKWRVACVRIPRFPIGAVWLRAIAEGNGSLLMPPGSDEQLRLPMGEPEVVRPSGWAPPSSTNDAVPNRPWGATPSSSDRPGNAGTRRTPDASAPDASAPGVSAPDALPLAAKHWDTLPIVLLDGQRVRVATAAAGRARIRAGMTIGEARARCAELRVAHWDEATIAQAVTRASATFVQASPQVAPAAGSPGTWWVGAGGLSALGGDDRLARHLLALARRWHPGARVGIADSCVAARAATWTAPGRAAPSASSDTSSDTPSNAVANAPPSDTAIVIVPPGRCAAYLAPAPLGLVPMDDGLRETLHALGVRTVGAFAALAGEDVERRWGAAGLAAWRLARGDDARRPVLARLDAPRAVTTEVSPSVPTMEPILFLVRAALDRLVQDLVHDGRAAAVVAITVTLDDARGPLPIPAPPHTVTREIRLSRALARTVPLLERCRALLDGWRLDAPVCAVSVAITATAPLHGAQGELLDPAWRDPAAADAAFARLRSTLGTDAVVRPVLQDTHRPDEAGTWQRVDDPMEDAPTRPAEPPPAASPPARPGAAPSPPPGSARPPAMVPPLALRRGDPPAAPVAGRARSLAASPSRPLPPSLMRPPALRQLETPERAEVRTTDGAPRTIRWREQVITVARAVGPERLTGDWWGAGYARDYWRCEDATGTSDLVLYRDCTASDNAWYIHGWYD